MYISTILNHSYLPIADSFSGWLCIYHFKHHQSTANGVTNIWQELFTVYGVPEEISTDGRPQFTSRSFLNFLKQWKIHHQCSFVAYPQSNGHVKVAAKTSKGIIQENILPDGVLNNNKVPAVIIQYHNTPLEGINLSPVQILFHQQLRDSLPAHPAHYNSVVKNNVSKVPFSFYLLFYDFTL